MRLTETATFAHLQFDSFVEAIDYASKHRSDAPNAHTGGATKPEYSTYSKFYDTPNYDAADALARVEYTAGTKALEAFKSRLDVSGRVYRQTITYDVTGDGGYDMGRVMSGVPECAMQWTETEETQTHGQVVRLAINCSVSGGIGTDAIFRRGAAIIALIDALETAGKRTELVIIKVNAVTEGDKRTFCIEIPLKAADEPVQLDKLSFALCHPSMNRRIGFALTYMCGRIGRAACGISYGAQSGYRPEADIYLARLDHTNSADWQDDASAIDWIKRQLTASGVELEEREA